MNKWINSSTSLEYNIWYMIAGYYNNNITLIGGYNEGCNTVFEYNINTLSISVNNSLPTRITQSYCNGHITLDSYIFFSNAVIFDDMSLQQNFYAYDMENKYLNNIGMKYPKPFATDSECYTTDGIKYIYIMGGEVGGWQTVPSFTFSIFNIYTNKWINGPNTSYPHLGAACIYIKYLDILYIFGGGNIYEPGGDIEILNNVSSVTLNGYNEKWQYLTNFVEGIKWVQAFSPLNSNTIFIYGNLWNSDLICYIWYIEEETVSKCEHSQVAHHAALVYVNNPVSTYYSFGGILTVDGVIYQINWIQSANIYISNN